MASSPPARAVGCASPFICDLVDGYRANCVVEAILESARNGSAWTKVPYRRRERYENPTVRTEVHEGRGADGSAPGADAAWFATRIQTVGYRKMGVGFPEEELGRQLHPACRGAAPDGKRTSPLEAPAESGRETRSTSGSHSTRTVRAGVKAALDASGIGILRRSGASRRPAHHDPAIQARRSTTSCGACSTRRRCSASTPCRFIGRDDGGHNCVASSRESQDRRAAGGSVEICRTSEIPIPSASSAALTRRARSLSNGFRRSSMFSDRDGWASSRAPWLPSDAAPRQAGC